MSVVRDRRFERSKAKVVFVILYLTPIILCSVTSVFLPIIMAVFVMTILFLSIFDATQQCLPKPDVLDSSPSLNKLENTIKKLFNASEEVEEKDAVDSGTASDHQMTSYNSNNTTTIINDLKRRDENSAEEPFSKCHMTRECNEMWKHIFGKCRCQ